MIYLFLEYGDVTDSVYGDNGDVAQIHNFKLRKKLKLRGFRGNWTRLYHGDIKNAFIKKFNVKQGFTRRKGN